MSEAAWDKAFTQGSKAMQDRLRKVHAKNPKFQSWLQKSGHAAGTSVKQASKEVKPSARVKSLQVKSLKAYGATKGVKVGGEHGSDEVKDTIAPLSRDQHSKVQAAQRAAKAATKAAEPKKPKVKKPLSQAERMAAIARAVTKAKSKDRFDIPTVNPDDTDHDDLRDLHQSLHIRRGYNEEIEMNEGKMKDIVTDREETARLAAQKEPPFTPDKKKISRGPGGPMSKATWLAQNALANHIAMKKKEVEQIDELSQGLIGRAADRAAAKSKEAGDYANRQQDWGNRTQNLYRDADYGIARHTEGEKGDQAARLKNALGLSPKSRKALKDTEKAISAANEEVEQIDELKKSTLASYVNKAVIDRVSRQERDALDFARQTVDARDKKQLGKTRQIKGLYVKMSPDESEKNLHKAYNRDIGIKRAVRRLASEEVDLVFEQDDTMEKKEMAQTQLHFMKYAAEEILEFIEMGGEIEEWYQNKLSKVHSDMEGLHSYIEGEKRRTGMVEEVEQIDEIGSKFGGFRTPAARKLLKKPPQPTTPANPSMNFEEKSKGTVAVTPKEKKLAAHHGDPKKITYGDVIKARIKSAAAKAMNKGK